MIFNTYASKGKQLFVATSVDRKVFLQAQSILMHCIGVSRLDGWLFLVSFGCLEFGIRIQKGNDDDDDEEDEKFYVIPIWLKLLQSCSCKKQDSIGRHEWSHYSSDSSTLFLNVFFEKNL